MRTWHVCAALGLLVVVIAALLTGVFPSDGAGYAPGYGAPVFAFEMARTVDDVIAVFGPAGDPARARRIAAMDAGNRWDFLFLAIYAAFVFSFLFAAYRQSGRRRWLALAALAPVAGVADAVENAILLGITSDLDRARGLAWLPIPVNVKFIALLITGAAAGAYLVGRRQALWSALGVVAAAAALAVAPALAAGARLGWLAAPGLAVCWIVMWAFSVRCARAGGALRGDGEGASAG